MNPWEEDIYGKFQTGKTSGLSALGEREPPVTVKGFFFCILKIQGCEKRSLPETNSKLAPENGWDWKMSLSDWGPPSCQVRTDVSLREVFFVENLEVM